MKSFWLADSAHTDRLGEMLARSRPPLAVVHLKGDLGAGKSTLARALLRALGVRGSIRSPTYTLVERYPLADGREAWHLDLYRIGDPGELEFLGLDPDEAALWLIEWPERGAGSQPPADQVVEMAVAGGGRRVVLSPASPVGTGWLEQLARENAGLEAAFAADS